MKRGKPAPAAIVMAHFDGEPLAAIARKHGITVARLRGILRQHSLYCFGRIEPSMVRRWYGGRVCTAT